MVWVFVCWVFSLTFLIAEAIDLLKKLSLEIKSKTHDPAEVTKKSTAAIPTHETSMTPVLQSIDSNICYFSNQYTPPYYIGDQRQDLWMLGLFHDHDYSLVQRQYCLQEPESTTQVELKEQRKKAWYEEREKKSLSRHQERERKLKPTKNCIL